MCFSHFVSKTLSRVRSKLFMLGVIATIKSQNSFEKLCDTNLVKHPHCVYTDSNFDVRPFDQLLTPVMTIFSVGVLSALGFFYLGAKIYWLPLLGPIK